MYMDHLNTDRKTQSNEVMEILQTLDHTMMLSQMVDMLSDVWGNILNKIEIPSDDGWKVHSAMKNGN